MWLIDPDTGKTTGKCPDCAPRLANGAPTHPAGQAAGIAGLDPWWTSKAMQAMRAAAAAGQIFGADDLVDVYGLAEPDVPARWGAVFRLAAQRGLIEACGTRQSRKASANGRMIRTWRGTSA